MPAGDLTRLETAIDYGADAVYAGIPRYSLRGRKKSFNVESLARGVEYVRRHNRKIYFTTNILARNAKVKTFMRALAVMQDLKPDAYIMSDPGLIYLANKEWPDMEIHLSVQANTMNYATAQFWYDQGVRRIILSRELHIGEIREIKERVPQMELEVFIHGSICVAHSGRCFISNYGVRRDANQGSCNNACRNPFHLFSLNDEGERVYYVEDKTQPGIIQEVEEDEHGTYLMNAKDLMALEYLPQLIEAGVDSFKVEGRTKSRYYAGLVARTYRQALDQYQSTGKIDPELAREFDKTANRGYTPGFLDRERYFREKQQETGVGFSAWQGQYYAGDVLRYDPVEQRLYYICKNRVAPGDEIEVFKLDGTNLRFPVRDIRDGRGRRLKKASGGIGEISLACPFEVSPRELISVVPAAAEIPARHGAS